ncbi:MAG: hypothetical protein ACRDWA_12155 [Acidimicrobiia bacterium]
MLRFAAVLLALAVVVAVAFQPSSEVASTTTDVLLDPPLSLTTTATATTTMRSSPSTTSVAPGRRLLAPGWEYVGEGDRVGGLAFGSGQELIVWGGREPSSNGDGPYLLSGVAWDHESLRSRPLPPAPFADCRGTKGAAWTGVELVVWFRTYADPGCGSGGIAAYDPATDNWREIGAPAFIEAGTSAVWTGQEVLAWRRGLALDPSTASVRQIEPLEINECGSSRLHADWTGDELLVMGAAQLHRYQPTTDIWDRLPSPPIGVIAQASAWTGQHLLAVNYLMEAALFDHATEEWARIESMPMRFRETFPQTLTSSGLTAVRMGSAMAVLDGETWVTAPGPVMVWDYRYPYGSMVIADGWLYQVGNFVLRRPVPLVLGGGILTEDVIPLQTMLFDIPPGWTAGLAPGGSGERHAYELESIDGHSCRLDSAHGSESPSVAGMVRLVRSWDGTEMAVGINPAANLALVDDSDRTSDWTAVTCGSIEVAQFMASHVWVSLG